MEPKIHHSTEDISVIHNPEEKSPMSFAKKLLYGIVVLAGGVGIYALANEIIKSFSVGH